MTDSTIGIIKFSGALLLFIVGLTYAVFSMSELDRAFSGVQGSETVYNSGLDIPEEVLWTGSQVVGKLYKLMEEGVPIVVNGRTFTTDEDVKNFQSSIILAAKYKQKIEIGRDGIVSRVVFSF